MSTTQPTNQTVKQSILYHQHSEDLDPGNNFFQCSKCGHYAGDPRSTNFICECPNCESIVEFYRIIA